MLSKYAYLIGDIAVAMLFLSIFFTRKDLRKLMLYSGFLYLVIATPCFFVLKILNSDVSKSVTPGYWAPPTLFDLGQKTGGLAIEDILFMFFASAIAAALYDVFFGVLVNNSVSKTLKKGHALLIGLLTGFAVYTVTPINGMYFLIIFQIVAGLVLVFNRRDLLAHSLKGALFFLVVYFSMYSIFNVAFPHFVTDYYSLQRTSHLLILHIPLEEYLYAISFGFLWTSIYEYEHRFKDRKSKRRKLRPQRA